MVSHSRQVLRLHRKQMPSRRSPRGALSVLSPSLTKASTSGALALTVVPDQLAVAFRGVLSFWTTGGEVSDELLPPRAALSLPSFFWVSSAAPIAPNSLRFSGSDSAAARVSTEVEQRR